MQDMETNFMKKLIKLYSSTLRKEAKKLRLIWRIEFYEDEYVWGGECAVR